MVILDVDDKIYVVILGATDRIARQACLHMASSHFINHTFVLVDDNPAALRTLAEEMEEKILKHSKEIPETLPMTAWQRHKRDAVIEYKSRFSVGDPSDQALVDSLMAQVAALPKDAEAAPPADEGLDDVLKNAEALAEDPLAGRDDPNLEASESANFREMSQEMSSKAADDAPAGDDALATRASSSLAKGAGSGGDTGGNGGDAPAQPPYDGVGDAPADGGDAPANDGGGAPKAKPKAKAKMGASPRGGKAGKAKMGASPRGTAKMGASPRGSKAKGKPVAAEGDHEGVLSDLFGNGSFGKGPFAIPKMRVSPPSKEHPSLPCTTTLGPSWLHDESVEKIIFVVPPEEESSSSESNCSKTSNNSSDRAKAMAASVRSDWPFQRIINLQPQRLHTLGRTNNGIDENKDGYTPCQSPTDTHKPFSWAAVEVEKARSPKYICQTPGAPTQGWWDSVKENANSLWDPGCTAMSSWQSKLDPNNITIPPSDSDYKPVTGEKKRGGTSRKRWASSDLDIKGCITSSPEENQQVSLASSSRTPSKDSGESYCGYGGIGGGYCGFNGGAASTGGRMTTGGPAKQSVNGWSKQSFTDWLTGKYGRNVDDLSESSITGYHTEDDTIPTSYNRNYRYPPPPEICKFRLPKFSTKIPLCQASTEKDSSKNDSCKLAASSCKDESALIPSGNADFGKPRCKDELTGQKSLVIRKCSDQEVSPFSYSKQCGAEKYSNYLLGKVDLAPTHIHPNSMLISPPCRMSVEAVPIPPPFEVTTEVDVPDDRSFKGSTTTKNTEEIAGSSSSSAVPASSAASSGGPSDRNKMSTQSSSTNDNAEEEHNIKKDASVKRATVLDCKYVGSVKVTDSWVGRGDIQLKDTQLDEVGKSFSAESYSATTYSATKKCTEGADEMDKSCGAVSRASSRRAVKEGQHKNSVEAEASKVIRMECNLQVLASVKKFGARYRATVGKVDVVFNGIDRVFPKKTATADNLEKTCAINYFSAYMLMDDLMNLASDQPWKSRFITMSPLTGSEVVDEGQVNFKNKLQEFETESAFHQSCPYNNINFHTQAKGLLNVFFQRRMEELRPLKQIYCIGLVPNNNLSMKILSGSGPKCCGPAGLKTNGRVFTYALTVVVPFMLDWRFEDFERLHGQYLDTNGKPCKTNNKPDPILRQTAQTWTEAAVALRVQAGPSTTESGADMRKSETPDTE